MNQFILKLDQCSGCYVTTIIFFTIISTSITTSIFSLWAQWACCFCSLVLDTFCFCLYLRCGNWKHILNVTSMCKINVRTIPPHQYFSWCHFDPACGVLTSVLLLWMLLQNNFSDDIWWHLLCLILLNCVLTVVSATGTIF